MGQIILQAFRRIDTRRPLTRCHMVGKSAIRESMDDELVPRKHCSSNSCKHWQFFVKMKKKAVEAGHQFAPIIRPDIQNPSARKGNSSSNIKNFPQVTPQQVQSISIQQARRIQLRASSWINWWQSSNSMDDGKRCVCTVFFFFSKIFRIQAKANSM